MMSENKLHLIEMTAEIVAAYVEEHALDAADLPALINQVHTAVAGISTNGSVAVEQPKPEPAVPIRKAVQPDYVVDLFTGKRFKSLKRHIRTKHNMSPEEYRAYWDLPRDFPIVAPNYAKSRSELARASGLGQAGRRTSAAA
jgi:predicted transcriptional regulator